MSNDISCDKEKCLIENSEVDSASDQVIARRFGVFGPLFSKLFNNGVEVRGVERVPENQRVTKNSYNSLFMWWSVNLVLTTVPIGVLAQYTFTLTLRHAVATTFFFGALGSAATAFIATLGPRTGLRTMVICRFSSGYIGGMFFSVLNIMTQLGFATTAVIIGGQTLTSVSSNELPLVGGIIVISVCCLIPCFIGYDIIHIYERYAWMITLPTMCCVYVLGSKAGYDVDAQIALEDTGRALGADILGFGVIVFGFAIGWAPMAADYNVRLPVSTNPWHTFILTFFGMLLPIVFTITLGATLTTIPGLVLVTNGNTSELIAQVLSPLGGIGKFILVLLAMSVVSNNIPNTYSTALSIQALGRPFAMVPRFLWVVFVFIVYTVIGVAGREHLLTILSNFLALLSFWIAFFIVIVAEEHFLFRREGGRLGGYNLDDWDNPSKLPVGIAALLACCFGITGAVVGMAQAWYTGPIGKLAGATVGADLGFELAACFAGVTFPPLRWLEIRLTGR